MGGNYEKSIDNQLVEVMGRLNAVEKDLRSEKTEHKEDVEEKLRSGKCRYQIREIGESSGGLYVTNFIKRRAESEIRLASSA